MEDNAENKSSQVTDVDVKAKKELPKLTPLSLAKDACYVVKSLIVNPDFSGRIMFPLLIAESIGLEAIILNVPYTEIDFSTYMQQISLIEKGELHYEKISGDTGPIVYPGGYVWIYSWLKTFTGGMEHIRVGQEIFRFLYLLTTLITFICYLMTNTKVKPYIIYLLLLSKRLHSIYVLRLFNDCFTTFFSTCAILSLIVATRLKTRNPNAASKMSFVMCLLSSDFLALAISVKMNALLYLPGFLVISYYLCNENLLKVLFVCLFSLFIFIGMNATFLLNSDPEVRKQFISGAFNFSRQFLYKWTVNWKFLSEEIFSSRQFQNILLACHVGLLLAFLFYKWLDPKTVTGGKSRSKMLKDGILKPFQDTISRNNIIFSSRSTAFVFDVMAISNLIGVLCSRSLHYQFLSWYFFSLPYLLFRTGLPDIIILALFIIHELSWDTYPSTPLSSGALVTVLVLVVLGNLFHNQYKRKVSNEKKQQ
ncbi:hypothetical protein HII13_001788 [Brettanomyces bruxellensis]|nr:hypothetical protein HII13_001788 [Brettanomyces bruxellensis]